MSNTLEVKFLPVECLENWIFLRFNILLKGCFLFEVGEVFSLVSKYAFLPLEKTTVPFTLLLFPHIATNAHFQGKKKEIKDVECRKFLSHFATQQDINWTQMTSAICCKCFQLILQGFSLDTRRIFHLFRFILLSVAYTCVCFSLTGHRKYRPAIHLQLPLHSTSSEQYWLLQLKTAFYI